MDNTTLSIVKTANTATYGGAGSAVFFGLSANEFGAICGVVIGLLGLVVNVWFRYRHLQLAIKESKHTEEQ